MCMCMCLCVYVRVCMYVCACACVVSACMCASACALVCVDVCVWSCMCMSVYVCVCLCVCVCICISQRPYMHTDSPHHWLSVHRVQQISFCLRFPTAFLSTVIKKPWQWNLKYTLTHLSFFSQIVFSWRIRKPCNLSFPLTECHHHWRPRHHLTCTPEGRNNTI